MLHENPWMADIDVDHWRNMQTLLLDSAKERRRIIVIHEAGEIQKFVHSERRPIQRAVERITDPRADAEAIYRANEAAVDFVSVFERRAFDDWTARFQDSWRSDEDLDAFVYRQYALMDEYPDGIVTYPGPARSMLGLQWRIGAGCADVQAAVAAFVPPSSSVVFGVFEGETLWSTLVLRFDGDRRVNVITTVDPTELALDADRAAVARNVVAWVNARYAPCSLGMFTSVEGARGFLADRDKLGALGRLKAAGDLILDPLPAAVSGVTAGSA